MTKHTLKPAADQIADAISELPFLYELALDGARKVLDDIQAAPIAKRRGTVYHGNGGGRRRPEPHRRVG